MQNIWSQTSLMSIPPSTCFVCYIVCYMHSYIVRYVVTDSEEDLPSIYMNTVNHADRSLFDENNVA